MFCSCCYDVPTTQRNSHKIGVWRPFELSLSILAAPAFFLNLGNPLAPLVVSGECQVLGWSAAAICTLLSFLAKRGLCSSAALPEDPVLLDKGRTGVSHIP